MNNNETTTLGGGCFWCIEAIFQSLPGVESVTSGYAGGKNANPTYQEVCTGDSGHAEVIRIQFDPARISFREILNIFWRAHDPTTLNRQGADHGTQYRSVIYYHNENQKTEIEASINELMEKQVFDDPIVTEISPVCPFYPAETYHQNYYQNNPNVGYCTYVIRPKLEKLNIQQR